MIFQGENMGQMSLFGEQKTKPDVILLDYVMTLVANYFDRPRGRVKGGYEKWIEKEEYRQWLVTLLMDYRAEGGKVVLITARSNKYYRATMARLRQVCPLEFDFVIFNELQIAPPKSKLHNLEHYIYKLYGKPSDTCYMAIESNKSTRAMYKKQGIAALPVPIKGEWDALPEIITHGKVQETKA